MHKILRSMILFVGDISSTSVPESFNGFKNKNFKRFERNEGVNFFFLNKIPAKTVKPSLSDLGVILAPKFDLYIYIKQINCR